MFPVYALYHYYPEAFWVRFPLAIALLAAGIVFAVLLYRKYKIDAHTLGWGIALWVYTLAVLYMTVYGRYAFDDYRARLIPFESYRQYAATGSESELRGIIGNILMLIPFSFMLAELFRNRKPVIIALPVSAVLTVSIEGLQYLTHTGTFEIDDIIHNFASAIIGVLLWKAINTVIMLCRKQKDKCLK